jgi:hypothetical protein
MDVDTIGITVGVVMTCICLPCISYCIFKFCKRPGGILDEQAV